MEEVGEGVTMAYQGKVGRSGKKKTKEELVFSHGDLGDSNILVKNDKISGFIDFGRSGKADRYACLL